ncbi:hypothetical protein P152DRAFT_467481 [Eremomyces bilateralis CBS 781.70]|uniref:Tat pathway signal sequence n=1 Tax=Eremomyces bilateralis CBS 781.70 TaxID=1392243 RepID=A0A6G1FZN3_9PEZI|nr:uncharacterized protein P152DRAFT_467481 [Eremomyces bilateralis CBS 781.70]KAF1811136.1 hypothetical protein P152DRAFT_467481 [Eremomyces bilateralis CBS 781.70]
MFIHIDKSNVVDESHQLAFPNNPGRWQPIPITMATLILEVPNGQIAQVVKDVGIRYSLIRFNGSLMKENIYRQNASPEVDAAWNSLGVNYRSLVVPESEAAASGLQPDQVKVAKKYGGGYVANVEGLHQLHCLNLLRQSLYYNYDYYKAQGKGAFLNDDHIVRVHVSHCLDILRQQLMCTVDLGVLGQVWWNQTAPRAYVDFNTRHMCRNFDDVREYAQARQLPVDIPPDYLEPPKEGDTVYAEMP